MKKILIVVLVLFSIFAFGCSKNEDSNVIKLNKVDIAALSNAKIKNIVNSSDLKQGIYKISTKSNTYIYFLGLEEEFTDISCKLESDTLDISSSLKALEKNAISKKLFVIYEKNSTASGNKAQYFENINLFVDEKKCEFTEEFLL